MLQIKLMNSIELNIVKIVVGSEKIQRAGVSRSHGVRQQMIEQVDM